MTVAKKVFGTSIDPKAPFADKGTCKGCGASISEGHKITVYSIVSKFPANLMPTLFSAKLRNDFRNHGSFFVCSRQCANKVKEGIEKQSSSA